MLYNDVISCAQAKEALGPSQSPPPSPNGSDASSVPDHHGDLEKQSTQDSPVTPVGRHESNYEVAHATSSRATSIMSRLRSRPRLAPFSHPLANEVTGKQYLVTFDGPDDPYQPMNWPMHKKIITLFLYGFVTMGSAFASAVFNAAIPQISHDYHVSEIVAVLGTALLLFGFAFGPLLWAPLSEVYGRRLAVLLPYFLAAIFAFATATAKDLQTIMITRFFTGFFGVAPVANVGGVIGDLFNPEQRAIAIIGYAWAVTGGPTVGPLIGGAIVVNTSWRWIQYTIGILMMFMLSLAVIYCDETYSPVLLVHKARRLRVSTGNWALHAEFEEWEVSLKALANKFLARPWLILFTPIGLCMNIYSAFVFGVFYMLLGAVPIIFEEGRGWNPVLGGTPFLAVLVGVFVGSAINYSNQKFYIKRFRAAGNFPVPEARLPPMMAGSFLFAGGIFLVAWTSPAHFHWIGPMIGLAMTGAGVITIFQSALNYLIDTFLRYAASAVAANTLLRCLVAGVLPIVVSPMYDNLGVQWASSLVGFIGTGMLFIPFLFYVWGRALRSMSVYSRDSVR